MSLEDLKKAIENRPKEKIGKCGYWNLYHSQVIGEWFEDFEKKFKAFQQDYMLERKQLQKLIEHFESVCEKPRDQLCLNFIHRLKELLGKVSEK